MGEWLPPRQPLHMCDLPDLDRLWPKPAGERWKCECGVVYVVTDVWQAGESFKQLKAERLGYADG